MKVLGLIPARAGSKGIPGKNKKLLAGKTLVHRAFESAQAAGVLDRIILSTDDPEIASAAQALGLEVPFVRPSQLAADDAAMIDVVIHAISFLQAADYRADGLLLLQPTAPLRESSHIRRAVELLADYDSVCSVVPLPKDICPHYLMKINANGFLEYFLPDGSGYVRRQDVPQAYQRDGTIYLTKTEILLEQRTFYGDRCFPMVLDPKESINIDEPADWIEAERSLGQFAA